MMYSVRYLVQLLGVIFILGMLDAGLTAAQPDTTRQDARGKYGGVGYVSVGYQTLNLEPVSQRIIGSSISYASLPERFVSFGGGGHAYAGSWLIGGEGHGFSGSNTAPNAFDIRIDGGYGFFNLGYRILSSQTTDIAPILGFGGGGYEMTIYDSQSDPSFDSIIDQPMRQSTLSASNVLLKASAAVSHVFYRGKAIKKAEESSILSLHLRAGYILSPFEGQWQFSGTELDGGPSIGMEGPFFRLSVGFGGY